MDPDLDVDVLVRTRLACHAVAEHVLAAALHAETGRIGLRFDGVGIATPEFGDRRRYVFDGRGLITDRGDEHSCVLAPTIADAARAVGITPGAPADADPPSTPLEPDAPLAIDPTAVEMLWTWFRMGELGLSLLRVEATDADATSPLVLWPEHFDLAIEIGDPTTTSRGTFGASPGDAAHPVPYLYVTHWSDEPGDDRWRDPFWNDPTFAGASLSMTEVLGEPEPEARVLEFYRAGRALMQGRRNG